MSACTKIAITVPTATFKAVERIRQRLGKSRSATISLALEEWLRRIDVGDADRLYVQGYQRQPEADDSWAVAAQASASWSAWDPGKPSRAAESTVASRKHSKPTPTPRTNLRRLRSR